MSLNHVAISNMVEKGMLNPLVLVPIHMEMLSYTYGWTPEQIRDMDVEDIVLYSEILSYRLEKEQSTVSKTQRKRGV